MSTLSARNGSNGAHEAIAILGIPLDKVNVSAAIDRIEQMIATGLPHYLVTANVDFLVQARFDIELRRILISADMVLCDGTPLIWASRLLGNPLPERVAGADLVPRLIQTAEEKSYRVFLLGAARDSAQRAVERVREKHPRIEIDYYSPPFNRLLEMDHEEIRRRIAEARPDMLFVSFGCPKQEKWIAMHYRELGVPVAVGVGATVDFIAETMKRAPAWMQRSGTEWIYRLLQEPRRLAGRYSKDLWVFGRAFAEQYDLERTTFRNGTGRLPEDFILEGAWRYTRLPELFIAESLSSDQMFSSCQIEPGACVVLDARAVRRMDGTALAKLVRWRAKIRASGSRLLLLAPSLAVQRTLGFAGLTEFFETASDLTAARSWMENRLQPESDSVRHQSTASGFRIFWHGEVTAANAESFWSSTSTILSERLAPGAPILRIELDLDGVSFMDSTGLGILIRLHKTVAKGGSELMIDNVRPAAMNVIRLAQLESLLMGRGQDARRLAETALVPGVRCRAV